MFSAYLDVLLTIGFKYDEKCPLSSAWVQLFVSQAGLRTLVYMLLPTAATIAMLCFLKAKLK